LIFVKVYKKMSAILKQLTKEKCLDILENLEHPQHQETSPDQVQNVDIKYEVSFNYSQPSR
jgi:hypothetical protein